MAGWYLFLVIIVAIVGMVLLISRFKWHPFIVLLLAGYFVGVLGGMPVDELISTLTGGFGSILGSNRNCHYCRYHHRYDPGKDRCSTDYGQFNSESGRKEASPTDHEHHRLYRKYPGLL